MGRTTTILRIALGLLTAGLLVACSGDDSPGNNNANGLNHNNDNQAGCADGDTRCQGSVIETCTAEAWAAGTDCADAGASCVENPGTGEASCVSSGCADGATRCAGASELETCTASTWNVTSDCTDSGQLCRADPATDTAQCQDLAWVHFPVQIVDPIMQGESLMVPIDGISFAYDPATDAFVTAFDRDFDDPSITSLWRVDGATGDHEKMDLTGTPFPEGENFCVGGEDWCQFVGFDPVSSEWVVVGPSTASLMRVTGGWLASLQAVSGTHPGDSLINHNHRFAWSVRTLFLYGATGPSGFGDTAFAFDLDTATWTEVAGGLDQVDDNCLAYDSGTDTLYSFGGRLTTDGGNTTQVLDTYAMIDVQSGNDTAGMLPAGMGPRRALSCAYDSLRDVIYVHAGSVVNDRWNEALNEYHNDLWVFDLQQQDWVQVIPDTESGTLGPPDSYGDQAFTGHPEGPNFGQNRGHLQYDADNDRLVIIGAVPIFTHEQLYLLDLTGLELLL
ncbi:MAG: kelch repeat-containing protein [bacterium]